MLHSYECKTYFCINDFSINLLLSFFLPYFYFLLQDKANKRRMLMAIDRRKKLLKNLRLVRYDAFEKVCEQLGITYSFPPLYYRRATHRWMAKKAFCLKVASTTALCWTCMKGCRKCAGLSSSPIWGVICVCTCALTHAYHHSITLCTLCVFCQVYNEVQKQKAEQRMRLKQSSASKNTESTKTTAA